MQVPVVQRSCQQKQACCLDASRHFAWYNPYVQARSRIDRLTWLGHYVDKITYEDVARDTIRGHTVAAVADCFSLAKDASFKIYLMLELKEMWKVLGMFLEIQHFEQMV